MGSPDYNAKVTYKLELAAFQLTQQIANCFCEHYHGPTTNCF